MRRLRYTFAHAPREGRGRRGRWFARLLDHTDLQNVSVYFRSQKRHRRDTRCRHGVGHSGPLFQAFLKKI